ncbi:guanylate kinase [Leptospira ryugenii]|uniref:Guanylate kinase n=1 Tax=Leptospira ryugenii TaxID=1917863 RepID=A0A2P2E129_9LEPT|nr:guanylate kinase [Leptospira ryugenii]GBF50506.1 guanylate kinase [Leptospira ryugenii]
MTKSPIPNLYIISSVAGGGKSTIIDRLLKKYPSFFFSISCTTRDIRPGDVPGKSYHFLSREEFQKQIDRGEFYEWALVHGNYYGTPKTPILDALERQLIVLLDLDVQGAKSVKELRPQSVTIFIQPPSQEIWIERLIKRGSDPKKSIETRIENGLKELEEAKHFDYIVVNDVLEKAVDQVERIIHSDLGSSASSSIDLP